MTDEAGMTNQQRTQRLFGELRSFVAARETFSAREQMARLLAMAQDAWRCAPALYAEAFVPYLARHGCPVPVPDTSLARPEDIPGALDRIWEVAALVPNTPLVLDLSGEAACDVVIFELWDGGLLPRLAHIDVRDGEVSKRGVTILHEHAHPACLFVLGRMEDMRGLDLSNRRLDHLFATGVDLCGANLSGATLVDANLNGTNLSGCDLTRADLSHACLSFASLENANLRGASLYHASLESAYIGGARFEGANIESANFEDATEGQAPRLWQRT